MSITAVSAISSYSQDPLQQQNGLRQALLTLQNALASGNVGKAQQALIHLQEDLQSARPQQNGIRTSAEVNPANTMRTDFQALQSALDSGDLAMAEEAFVRVLQDGQKITGQQVGLASRAARALPQEGDGDQRVPPTGTESAGEPGTANGNLLDVKA